MDARRERNRSRTTEDPAAPTSPGSVPSSPDHQPTSTTSGHPGEAHSFNGTPKDNDGDADASRHTHSPNHCGRAHQHEALGQVAIQPGTKTPRPQSARRSRTSSSHQRQRAAQHRAATRKALASLDRPDRLLVVLNKADHLTVNEIATVTNRPEWDVRISLEAALAEVNRRAHSFMTNTDPELEQ